ncbi:hypothetical protein HDU80_006567 [Chytriomyces hyalinus]|nr:hypothetical protein HDU80_006567 [Chytriomyces hyalinus]
MLLFGQAHFYDAYVDLLEVQSKVPSLETAQPARHAFKWTNWSCYASEYLEMLKMPVSRFEPKYEPGKQAIRFPINAVATSFSDDESLARLVRIIKKLKEDRGRARKGSSRSDFAAATLDSTGFAVPFLIVEFEVSGFAIHKDDCVCASEGAYELTQLLDKLNLSKSELGQLKL